MLPWQYSSFICTFSFSCFVGKNQWQLWAFHLGNLVVGSRSQGKRNVFSSQYPLKLSFSKMSGQKYEIIRRSQAIMLLLLISVPVEFWPAGKSWTGSQRSVLTRLADRHHNALTCSKLLHQKLLCFIIFCIKRQKTRVSRSSSGRNPWHKLRHWIFLPKMQREFRIEVHIPVIHSNA